MHSGKTELRTPPSPRRQREPRDRGPNRKEETRLALALLLLAALVIGWPWLSGRVTIPWDAKAHFQPQIQFLAQSLAEGQSPSWAPYVFSGHPQIADPQSMIFAPPFLALALVNGAPSLRAVDTTLLAMLFLSGAALILWFRDQDWHWAGGLLAALAFCYGASMAWRIQHTGQVLSLAYLPLALLYLRSSTGALLAALGHCRRHRDGRHRARPRSSGLARHLFAGGLCPLAHCRPHHSRALPCVQPCCR